MQTSSYTFLEIWHQAMAIGAIIMVIVSVIIFLMYVIRLSSIKDYKQKYDFINQREIKSLKLVFICLGIATTMAINLYAKGQLTQMGLWFVVRTLISIFGGTLVGYVAVLILDYYYPTVVAQKLQKWRYTPRVNPQTGNAMRLLSEEEEDVHLEEGMKAEENIFSMDYDVWVDEKTWDVKIEKYWGHLQALKCNSCGFYTMKVVREEIVEQPADGKPGELIKHYECSYCESVRATAFKISAKEPEDYKAAALKGAHKNEGIELVKLEIHSSMTGKRFFEFPNIAQVQKFLEKYKDEIE